MNNIQGKFIFLTLNIALCIFDLTFQILLDVSFESSKTNLISNVFIEYIDSSLKDSIVFEIHYININCFCNIILFIILNTQTYFYFVFIKICSKFVKKNNKVSLCNKYLN